jgi:ribosome silencing factor RsfS/YbeB/iojap
LWGDGKVFLKYQKVKFKSKKSPSLKRIKKYLEHEQAKDFSVLDLQEYSKNAIFSTLLICSGMSPRHISRMAYGLLKALKQAEVPDSDLFQVLGTRESGWMILTLKDLHVHLITEELRPEINIEEVWKKPLTEPEIQEFNLNAFEVYKRYKKR